MRKNYIISMSLQLIPINAKNVKFIPALSVTSNISFHFIFGIGIEPQIESSSDLDRAATARGLAIITPSTIPCNYRAIKSYQTRFPRLVRSGKRDPAPPRYVIHNIIHNKTRRRLMRFVSGGKWRGGLERTFQET